MIKESGDIRKDSEKANFYQQNATVTTQNKCFCRVMLVQGAISYLYLSKNFKTHQDPSLLDKCKMLLSTQMLQRWFQNPVHVCTNHLLQIRTTAPQSSSLLIFTESPNGLGVRFCFLNFWKILAATGRCSVWQLTRRSSTNIICLFRWKSTLGLGVTVFQVQGSMKRTAFSIIFISIVISCTWTRAADLNLEDSKHNIPTSIKHAAETKSGCRIRGSYLTHNLNSSKKIKGNVKILCLNYFLQSAASLCTGDTSRNAHPYELSRYSHSPAADKRLLKR